MSIRNRSPWHSHCHRRWQLTKQQCTKHESNWNKNETKNCDAVGFAAAQGWKDSKSTDPMKWKYPMERLDDTSPFTTAKIIIIMETLWLHEFIGFSCFAFFSQLRFIHFPSSVCISQAISCVCAVCAVFHHSFPVLLLFLIHLYVVLHPFETIVIFHYFSFIKA